MNLNTSSRAGAGAIDLKIASFGAGAWSILGQLPSPGQHNKSFLKTYIISLCFNTFFNPAS